jgi:predicted dehydrogenase
MSEIPVVKLGVVGFGRHFRRYLLPNVVAEPLLSIRVIAELDPRLRAEARVRLPGIPVVERAEDVFADPELDAVLVCTTPASHVPLAEAALRAGKHVFVEKPLGISSEALRPLADLADERGLAVMSGLMWRYAPVTGIVTRWLAERGAHTRLLNMTVTLPPIDLRPAWRGDWGMTLRQTAYYDGFVHPIDWAVHMLGPIGSVHVRELPGPDGCVTASLWLAGADGARAATLDLVTGSDAYEVTAWGHVSDGSLWQVDTLQHVTVTARPTWTGTEGGIRDRVTWHWDPGQLYRGWGRYGYAEEFAAFATAVAHGKAESVTKVAETSDVIAAAVDSAESGMAVPVRQTL